MNNSDAKQSGPPVSNKEISSHGLNDFSHTLPIRLLRARHAAVSQFQPIFRKYNVTEQQWRILRMVTSVNTMTAGELSQAIFISMPRLSRIMQSLEARGLIHRRANEDDLRKTMVSSTSAAQAMVAEPLFGRISATVTLPSGSARNVWNIFNYYWMTWFKLSTSISKFWVS